MAVNSVATSVAALDTQLDNETYNPDVVGTPASTVGAGNRKVIHISLVVDGVSLDIGEVYDALTGITGVEIQGEKDVLAYTRGTYIFNVGPA